MADNIQSSVSLDAEVAGFKQGMNQANAAVSELIAGLKQATKELNKTAKAQTAATASARNAGKAEGRLNAERKEGVKTSKSLAMQETLLSAIYTKNSRLAQQKYLTSLTGLRSAMHRLNAESKHMLVIQNGVGTKLSDTANKMVLMKIKADLLVRTLDNMSTRALNLGKNLQWTGRQMMVGITLPVTAMGVAAVKSYAEWDKAIIRTEKLLESNKRTVQEQAKDIELQSKALQKAATRMSEETFGIPRTEVMRIMGTFGQIGAGVEEIQALTERTLEFNLLGDLEDVDKAGEMVRVLFQSLRSEFGSSEKALEELGNSLKIFNRIEDETSLSMEGIAESLPTLAPLARTLGTEVEVLTSFLSAMTQEGYDAGESANAMRLALNKMPAAMAMLERGADGSGGRLKFLTQTIKDFNKANPAQAFDLFTKDGTFKGADQLIYQTARAWGVMDDATKAVFSRSFFGAEQFARLAPLMDNLNKALQGDVNQDVFKALNLIQDLSGADASWGMQITKILGSDSVKLAKMLESMKNSVQDLGKEFFTTFGPYFKQFIDWLRSGVKWFQNLDASTKKWITRLLGIAVAVGPLTYITGQMILLVTQLAKMTFVKPLKAIFGTRAGIKAISEEGGDFLSAIGQKANAATVEILHDLEKARNDGKITAQEYVDGVDRAIRKEAQLKAMVESVTDSKREQAAVANTPTGTGTGLIGHTTPGTRGPIQSLYRRTGGMAGQPNVVPPGVGPTLEELAQKYPRVYRDTIDIMRRSGKYGGPGEYFGVPTHRELLKYVADNPSFVEGVRHGVPEDSKKFLDTVKARIKKQRELRAAKSAITPEVLEKIFEDAGLKHAHLRYAADDIHGPALAQRQELQRVMSRVLPNLLGAGDFDPNLLMDDDFIRQTADKVIANLPRSPAGRPITGDRNIMKAINDLFDKDGDFLRLVNRRRAYDTVGVVGNRGIGGTIRNFIRDLKIGADDMSARTGQGGIKTALPIITTELRKELTRAHRPNVILDKADEDLLKLWNQQLDDLLTRGIMPPSDSQLYKEMKRGGLTLTEGVTSSGKPGGLLDPGKHILAVERASAKIFQVQNERLDAFERNILARLKDPSLGTTAKKNTRRLLERVQRIRTDTERAYRTIMGSALTGALPTISEVDELLVGSTLRDKNGNFITLDALLAENKGLSKGVRGRATSTIKTLERQKTIIGNIGGRELVGTGRYGQGSEAIGRMQRARRQEYGIREGVDVTGVSSANYGPDDFKNTMRSSMQSSALAKVFDRATVDLPKIREELPNIAKNAGIKIRRKKTDKRYLREILAAFTGGDDLIGSGKLNEEMLTLIASRVHRGVGDAGRILPKGVYDALDDAEKAQFKQMMDFLEERYMRRIGVPQQMIKVMRDSDILGEVANSDAIRAATGGDVSQAGEIAEESDEVTRTQQDRLREGNDIIKEKLDKNAREINDLRKRRNESVAAWRKRVGADANARIDELKAVQATLERELEDLWTEEANLRSRMRTVPTIDGELDPTGRGPSERTAYDLDRLKHAVDPDHPANEIARQRILHRVGWKPDMDLEGTEPEAPTPPKRRRSLLKRIFRRDDGDTDLKAPVEGTTAAIKKLGDEADDALKPSVWATPGRLLTKANSPAKKLTGTLRSLGKAAMMPVDLFTGGMGSMVVTQLATKKIALMIPIFAAVAAAIYFIKQNWDEVGPHIISGLEAVRDAGKNLYNAIVEPFKQMFSIVDEGGAKGKSMSETWETVGILINRALTVVATALNVLATVARPISHILAAISYVLISLLNTFGMLPGPIQLMAAALLLLRLGPVKAMIDAILIGLFNLVGKFGAASAAAQGFAASMTAAQAALGVLAIAAIGISMGVQSIKQSMQEGTNAANEYWAALSEDRELGPQQSLKDVEGAYAQASDDFKRLNRRYEEQKKKQGGSGFLGKAARAAGALPGISTKSDDERKKAMALEAQLEAQRAKMLELEGQYKRQTNTISKLKKEYGLTEKQIIEFAKANNINLTGKTKRVLEKFAEKWKESKDDIEKNPWEPTIDGAGMDDGLEDLEEKKKQVTDFISSFQSELRSVIDGWKQAALESYRAWADGILKTYDDQIKALDDLDKAEAEAQRKRDYRRRKEEFALKRRDLEQNYIFEKNQAVYEGRYDDARQIDYQYGRDTEALDRDIASFEEEHQKELIRIERDAQRERIKNEQEAKKEQLAVQEKALSDQLEVLTKYLPRNATKAKEMQQAILDAMSSKTGGYRTIAEEQSGLWSTTWHSAMATTKDKLADEAWWAGENAMNQFAKALGIEVNPTGGGAPGVTAGGTSTASPIGSAVGDESRTGSTSSGSSPWGRTWQKPEEQHTGGPIGNTSMSPSDVPATLQTGEYVVRRSAVSKLGTRVLETINRGELPLFHEGGEVGMLHKAMGGKMHEAIAGWKAGFIGLPIGPGGNKVGVEQYKAAMMKAAMAAGQTGYAPGTAIDTAGKTIGEIVDTMISGIHPEFKARLESWNREMGGKFDISRGYRSMAQQAYLYDRWLRRVPGQALAAPPGRSMHNFGLAVDLASPSTTTAAERAAGTKYGLRWPMSFEPWHVEPVEARAWRDAILSGVMPGGTGFSSVGDDGGLTLKAGMFGMTGTGYVPGGATGINVPPEVAKSIVRGMLANFGWGAGEWPALERLVQGESSWRADADNPNSTAAGLFQKLTRVHGPVESTVEGQALWGLNYIKSRYGTPSAAYAKWLSRSPHWYHEGGLAQLMNGGQILRDGVAKIHAKETVLTAPLSSKLEQGINALASAGAGGGVNITVEIGQFYGGDRELAELERRLEKVRQDFARSRGQHPRKFGSISR